MLGGGDEHCLGGVWGELGCSLQTQLLSVQVHQLEHWLNGICRHKCTLAVADPEPGWDYHWPGMRLLSGLLYVSLEPDPAFLLY